jgi:hypothetical protein
MKPARRWFQYSLRSFLILLTALAVWLGVVVNRAREQREAVKAIDAEGGWVRYDWEEDPFGSEDQKPPEPAWLLRLFGKDFFRNVESVGFLTTSDFRRLVPHLKRLRKLRTVSVPATLPNVTVKELEAALPDCDVELDGHV